MSSGSSKSSKGSKPEKDKVVLVDTIRAKLVVSLKSGNNGVLVGWKYNDRIMVTGCMRFTSIADVPALSAFLPEGISVCGTFSNKEQRDEHRKITHEKKFIHLWLDGRSTLKCILASGKAANITEVSLDSAKEIIKTTSVLFQVKGTVTLPLEKSENITFDEKVIIPENTTFFLPARNALLSDTSSKQKTVMDLLKGAADQEIKIKDHNDCVQAAILKCMSTSNKAKSPVIRFNAHDEVMYQIPAHFNTLCYIRLTTPLNKVPSLLKVSLHRQLFLMKHVIAENHNIHSNLLGVPVLHHFFVPGWCHPVSVCYPANLTDDQLAGYRRDVLHPVFLEAPTRPIFRRTIASFLSASSKKQKLILNPHLGLNNPTNGSVYMVQGKVDYHHYNQDNVSDSGWGCSYRSLQTLVSWFRHQGYTDKAVPTHKEVQQVLVKIKDKPKGFVGTKKWIGSIEVSNVLNEYIGVTCKISYVSKGSDLVDNGRELSMHFLKHGTPVMIGGGVLAHTILGVCFSEITGETSFLILDPHYTGAEDLKTIQDKGWCGWKSDNFWNQKAYYNLCLPQRPELC